MMQQQTSIHIKAELDGDFRRFALTTPTFQNLGSVLRQLYEFKATDEFKIKFLDEENDWVLIASDSELLYAVEVNGSPLRLKVLHVEGTTSTTDQSVTEVPVATTATRGRGRGKARGGLPGTQQDRLKAKSDRLTERISNLEAKLSSGNLNSERERVLRWKLLNFQQKLAVVNQRQSSSESPLTKGNDANVDEPTAERGGRGRGRGLGRGLGRGKGRGSGRPVHETETSETPVADTPMPTTTTGKSPSLIGAPTHFLQCKANLQAARKAGNKAEIQTCLAAFKEAKEAMQANPGMTKLRECRQQKKQCMAALREAQSNGDEAKIQARKAALNEAIRNLKQVKTSVFA